MSVLYALEKGISLDQITFSSDGNAGLDKLDAQGNLIGFRRADFDQNYLQFKALVQQGGVPTEQALKVITSSPAKNLGLKNKGIIAVGADADFCCLDGDLVLQDVIAGGKLMMEKEEVLVKGHFE